MKPKPEVIVLSCYNGKVVDMKYIQDPKRRFAMACMRIHDNGARRGLVQEGDKIYLVTAGSRKAKLLSGTERDEALEEIERLSV